MEFLKQWMLKITEYADRLLDGLDDLDWPASTKEMQRNWIGRSEGTEIDFALVAREDAAEDPTDKVPCFTTRVDTIYGSRMAQYRAQMSPAQAKVQSQRSTQ